MQKPYAEACERNRAPILAALRTLLSAASTVLEVGSGTGQHAVYFGAELPHLVWQTSDVAANHEGIRAWLSAAGLPNVLAPLALDVAGGCWPAGPFDAVYSANTLHIMSWEQVLAFFSGAARATAKGGLLCVYGPFNYGGAHTSPGNEQFDRSLRARDPASGLRDFENVDAVARSDGYRLEQDIAMPANNRLLVWRLVAGSGPSRSAGI